MASQENRRKTCAAPTTHGTHTCVPAVSEDYRSTNYGSVSSAVPSHGKIGIDTVEQASRQIFRRQAVSEASQPATEWMIIIIVCPFAMHSPTPNVSLCHRSYCNDKKQFSRGRKVRTSNQSTILPSSKPTTSRSGIDPPVWRSSSPASSLFVTMPRSTVPYKSPWRLHHFPQNPPCNEPQNSSGTAL